MARSNIGRLLNERADRELNKMGLDLLDGVCHDMERYQLHVGRATGIKWMLEQLDEIEGDKE